MLPYEAGIHELHAITSPFYNREIEKDCAGEIKKSSNPFKDGCG